MYKKNFPAAFAALAIVAMASPAVAVDFTWDGIGGNDAYSTNGNWFNGTAPSGSSGNSDRAIFNSTATGGKIVNIGAATITDQFQLTSGGDGYNFIGSGTYTGNVTINSNGTNTLATTIDGNNNFGLSGNGTLIIDNGGQLTRSDTMSMDGYTVNVLSGGVFGGTTSAVQGPNRLRIQSNTNVINVEQGGFLGVRHTLHMDGTGTATINVEGEVSAPRVPFDNNGKTIFINDGGLMSVTLANELRKNGGDGTIDMAASGAVLALRGGDANTDTLAEFYDLTTGFDGDDFRYFDGMDFVLFDDMVGTDFFDLSFEQDYQGTGQGFTVLTTVSTAAVPEPASIAIWTILGLLGLGYGVWRRRKSSVSGC